MGTQDNFSQSKEGCCKWETLVDIVNILCTQRNLCVDTTFLIGKSYVEYTKVFVCWHRVSCVSLFHGFFLVGKVTF